MPGVRAVPRRSAAGAGLVGPCHDCQGTDRPDADIVRFRAAALRTKYHPVTTGLSIVAGPSIPRG